ncbi:MAG: GNAT family N-acetyltransferase [Phototrophicaceae bacterium]|jgi:CelD/BcsL family acetyltransferase involved in cellulose biosynthesis
MKVIEYSDPVVFDTLKPHWNSLVQQSSFNSPFALWEWYSAWWAAYHPGQLWVITYWTDEDVLIGIVPCFIAQVGTQRMLYLVGHIDVTDYMDIIVHLDYAGAVYQSLAQHLQQTADRFDAVAFANLQPHSPTYQHLAAMLETAGFEVGFTVSEVSPQIVLPQSYDAYVETILDSRERKEVKRKMRHAQGGEYAVTWSFVGVDDDLQAALDLFLALMASADEDKAAFLTNPQHLDFFRRLMPSLHALGLLKLAFIYVDGVACAAYLNFDYANTLFVYNSGIARQKYGALSPGIVLLQYLVQWAIERGYSVFDFLRGNEDYKYKMGAKDVILYQLNATLRK